MKSIRDSSLAVLSALAVHYAALYLTGAPLLTEAIAEWVMARTPAAQAVALLVTLGPWAKPFAVTGGLAALGFALWLARLGPGFKLRAALLAALAAGYAWLFEYRTLAGNFSFWLPAAAASWVLGKRSASSREGPRPGPVAALKPGLPRRLVIPAIMAGGAGGVALESFLRDRARSRGAVEPVTLFPFEPPRDRDAFAPGLVRKAVTPVGEFYGMSKNAVDPVIHPSSWKLHVTVDGQPLAEFGYAELLNASRINRYVTLRCVSNTLKSDLMGTALWTGFRLDQIVDPRRLPSNIIEAAFIGVDGHDDSLPVDYAFSSHVLLAAGMNGKTLNRTHGFPLRVLAPRYYGFKSVKWLREIRFVSRPYYGTWPKMNFTKSPVIHTGSYIDRIVRSEIQLRVGGVSFSGAGAIRAVLLRAGRGEWVPAALEPPLSPYTWTRWSGALPDPGAEFVEARAQDEAGRWQALEESPLYPDGVAGPTIRRVPS